jgi:RHS repeat-associated protein
MACRRLTYQYFSFLEVIHRKSVPALKKNHRNGDHLGNIRLSYTDKNQNNSNPVDIEIIEENNYYPFGLEHKGYNSNVSANGNSVAQKFKYNSVELEESLGLNLYKTNYRQYNPSIGRFFSIDPLTEIVPAINPYQFSFNNPVFFTDPLGLIPSGVSLQDFLFGLLQKTPDDGLVHKYDSNGNQTGTYDPDEIAISENRFARGVKPVNKREQKYFDKIRKENAYLNSRGLRGTPEILTDLILNAGLNAIEIAEVAKLRTTLVKKLKAQYMMSIFSPDIVADILFIGLGSGSSSLRNKTFDYLARGESYATIGSTGKFGERILKILGGESQVGFETSTGWRYIDQLVNGVAHESKVGYKTLTKSIVRQIAKDVELITNKSIKSSTWHFFKSPITGKIGASKPLLEALKKSGIKVIMH